MTVTGKLSITFDSDWQCGSGLGRHGSIDRAVVRDVDGLPYVPARTLLGIWRDACEKAALGLDDGTPNAWSALVKVLFGAGKGESRDPDDARGVLTVRPARLPAQWRAALGPASTIDPAQQVLRAGLTQPRYGVKIDDLTGVAQDDTLRLLERARAGLTVHTDYSAEVDGATWAVELLLLAGASLIHHLGSSRRRGAGRCTVLVDAARLATLIDEHADEIATFTVGQVTRVRPLRPAPVGDLGKAKNLRPVLRLRFRTEQPVIAGAGVQGNVILSHEFVPGATVLPVVARALGARASELIRHGHLVVTDATPVIDGTRGTRTPLAVQSADKGRQWAIDGRAINALTTPTSGAKPVGLWAAVIDAEVTVAGVALASTAHASIDDQAQRPLADGLFTIEAIPAGIDLESEVWVSEEVSRDEREALEALEGTTVTLGRYRRGDYGTVRITVTPMTATVPAGDALGEFSVALTSDCYLVDPHGLPVPTVAQLAKELSRRLGVQVTARQAVVSVSRRDSWSATTALPRTTFPCLGAGSSVEFTAAPAVSRADLQSVLDRGLGSRTVEGFGRAVVLDLPNHLTVTQPVGAGPDAAAPAPEPEDPAWRDLRAEAWRREIVARLRGAASRPEVRRTILGEVTNSQRGTLRRAAGLLITDRDAVARWLSATRSDEHKTERWGGTQLTRIEQWVVASDNQTWRKRLAQLVNDNDKVSATVPGDLGGVSPRVVAATFLTECLSQEALARKGRL